MQGDLGWKKLEERRDEMKVLFVKRLEGMVEIDRCRCWWRKRGDWTIFPENCIYFL